MSTPALPPSRQSGRYAVALVCTGNICRSPMADVVLEARLDEAGLADRVRVTSGGTEPWHVGEPMDPRAAGSLRQAGYDPSRHRARRVTGAWFDSHDLVLGMDRSNLADLAAVAHPQPGGRADVAARHRGRRGYRPAQQLLCAGRDRRHSRHAEHGTRPVTLRVVTVIRHTRRGSW